MSDDTEIARYRLLWQNYRNRMPDGARSFVVHDWLPTDRSRFHLTNRPCYEDIKMDLPKTVRFELQRVVHSEDSTIGAVRVLANGVEIAVEGYHTVRHR